jgi:hypothetical protein
MGEYVSLIEIGVQTAIFLTGGFVMVIRNDATLKSFQKEMASMQKELSTLSQVVTKQAVQDERITESSRRMTMLEQRVEDLRRGRGYVQDREASTVDREY